MFGSKINYIAGIIVLLFFVLYLTWVFNSYWDVVWMDQIQYVAGNIKHYYDHDLTVQDFYTKPPFLSSFSTICTFLNCKLLGYNTYVEVVLSGVFLFLIALYFIKQQAIYFNRWTKLFFVALCSLIVFGLQKWEVSLWGLGWGHYLVILITFICIDISHKYYFNKLQSPFVAKNFLLIYISLASFAILEATSYFFPFMFSMILVLIINRKVFGDGLDKKKWKTVFITTLGLLIFAFLINSLVEWYSGTHPYDGYGKTGVSQNISGSLEKIIQDPLHVAKFFFLSNIGNLIDSESYMTSPFWKGIMPFIGFLVVAAYCYALFVYIKRKQFEYLYPIHLLLYAVLFYGTILIGRVQSNDVYLGTSSRYSSATFTGILGLATIFLSLFVHNKSTPPLKRVLYILPVLLICICYLIADNSQWHIGKYRKVAYKQMADNLKANKNLEMLQANSVQIAESAREVLINNKLNVFKPETRLKDYTIKADLINTSHSGFYDLETSPQGSWRWTNGKGEINLPNIYTSRSSFKVKLICNLTNPDTPRIVLNDNLYPSAFKPTDGGFEYDFPVCKQNVFFKMAIINKSFTPNQLNKENLDLRTLGLVFSSVVFYE